MLSCHMSHHTSDARRPAEPHIVTLFTVHTSLDMTVSSPANRKPGEVVRPIRAMSSVLLCRGLASVNIEDSDPSSCLLSHDNNIYCQSLKYENVKRKTQDSALPV